MGNIVSLVLDLILVALLVAVLFHAIKLSRKITALRESRKEMDATIRQFFEASAKAELAIKNFQKSASDTSAKLDGDTKRAQLLSDELKLMIDSGNGLAERLETVVEAGRAVPGYGTQPGLGGSVDDGPPPLAASLAPPKAAPANQPAGPKEVRGEDAPAPGSIEAAAEEADDGDSGGAAQGDRQEGRSR
ncbi:MAG: DUF6468 domain-containing protein, partial [Pseudomonadota bacterium]